MSHELEIIDGVAQMCYNGNPPWHNLGVRVPSDLMPGDMLRAAGLDWKVEKRQNQVTLNGSSEPVNSYSLVRLRNGRHIKKESVICDHVSEKWFEVQNSDIFNFFNDWVLAGGMEMHTAGSLRGGQVVWALARIKESFYVVKKKDEVESYMLLMGSHRYGLGGEARFTPIRVVCNNTLSLALGTLGRKEGNRASFNHRKAFNPEEIKEKLGMAHESMSQYKEAAQFLAKVRYQGPNVVEYLKRLFPSPVTDTESKRKRKELSKGASTALAILETQPGADISPGSWWSAMNAATFYTNHLMGRTEDNRVFSLFRGHSANLNLQARDLAVEFAKAS